MQCKEMDDGSVIEELMLPLKKNAEENGRVNMENDGGDMKNWMSSVQLWNSNFNKVDDNKKPNIVPELKLVIPKLTRFSLIFYFLEKK